MKIKCLLIVFIIPIFVHAQFHDNNGKRVYYDVEVNGIYYRLDKNSNEAMVVMGCTEYVNPHAFLNPVKVSSYKGDVVIPESFVYNNVKYMVTSIQGNDMAGDQHGFYGAFQDCSELTSVTIPKSIKTIGNSAFSGCKSLISVNISDISAWCNISFNVYANGMSLQYYDMTTNPLSYAHDLYLNGNKVTDLVIPDDIVEIKQGTFIGGGFKSITLHKSVISIDNYAFDECDKLEHIYSYSPAIMLNEYYYVNKVGAFQKETSAKLHVRERYKDNYTGEDISNLYTEWNKFQLGSYVEGIDFNLRYYVDGIEVKRFLLEHGESIFPENEPTKEGYTFSGWSEIPETMPDQDVTVTGTFSPNTYKLTYIVDGEEYKVVEVKCDASITAETCPTRKGMTFSGWDELPEKMPGKDIEVKGTFSWSKSTIDNVIYEVSDTTNNFCKAIGNESASGAIKIAEAVCFDFSYNVTTITDNLFNGCKDITSIEIPATVTTIGERAFASIDKLTDVTIYAEDVPETDRTAFENSYTEDYVTLHVPAKALEKYKSAAPWKNFKEIVAIEGTESEPAKYTLIYQVDGETYKTFELEEGAEITALEEPTKEGYTFSGWSTIPATMPAKDIIITGTFTKNETEEVDTGEDVIMISSAGQTTWCSKYDLDFTDIDGLKAYIAPGYDRESGTIWLMRVFKVPAGEGILLMGDANEYRVPHKPTTTYYTNMFVGTTEAKTIYESENGYTNYYLSSGSSGVGFYRVTDADGIQLKANRAYLPLKTSTQASTRGFIGMEFGEDGTTGMRNLTPTLSKGEGVYYNLQGQRVDKPGKGLYIVNGKKVVIRSTTK